MAMVALAFKVVLLAVLVGGTVALVVRASAARGADRGALRPPHDDLGKHGGHELVEPVTSAPPNQMWAKGDLNPHVPKDTGT